jgi:hypothetical protein
VKITFVLIRRGKAVANPFLDVFSPVLYPLRGVRFENIEIFLEHRCVTVDLSYLWNVLQCEFAQAVVSLFCTPKTHC